MLSPVTSFAERLSAFCIAHRRSVIAILALLTLFMLSQALRVEVRAHLEDLIPGSHPYVKVHERFKRDFGGSNAVTIMLERDQGDIFDRTTLGKIRKVTQDLRLVKAVNEFQITSIASKKLKTIRSSTDGIETTPLMWPDLPRDDAGIARLREAVLANPLVYGVYVSTDLKAAVISVDFYDSQVDYGKAFDQIRAIAQSVEGDGVKVRMVGAPILFGWVNHYLPETVHIFLATIGLLVVLLFLTARTWRGTLLPLLAGTVSAIWALGAARLIGFNVDPLVIVVAFLITARSISHSVQLVARFDDEIAAGAHDAATAARASMSALFKPGMLGVIADAGCMLVVLLTPITLMQKVAVIGTVWVLTIAVSAVVLTPVLLSWIRNPRGYAHPIDLSRPMQAILDLAVHLGTSRWRYAMLGGAAIVFVVSGLYSFRLTVGDANPGSPILWPDAPYNRDAAAINAKLPGTDRMFVVFAGKRPDAVKQPEVLDNIAEFQKYMVAQPEIGASLSIADVVPMAKKVLREDNPRYLELGQTPEENGELINIMGNSSEPGDMDRFIDTKSQYASVLLYFRDLQGQTIRTAVTRIKDYVRAHPTQYGEYWLAGGVAGVSAAINEVLLSGQIESVAFAFLVLVLCCAVAYRSLKAGIFFMVPVALSNTLTFSFMAFHGIGMNINTVPVAALGIGLGVDYAFYVVDGVREELHAGGDSLARALLKSLNSAGRGVLITASTLIVSVVLWSVSSLRFQAEMGLLMAIWLGISAFCALFVIPAMICVFRPAFIVGEARLDEPALPDCRIKTA